jgi:hypothetical protein
MKKCKNVAERYLMIKNVAYIAINTLINIKKVSERINAIILVVSNAIAKSTTSRTSDISSWANMFRNSKDKMK